MTLSESPAGPLPLSKALELALHSNGGFPHLPRPPSRHAVPTTPVDRAGAQVGDFPARTAFPVPEAGRHPRLHFRGLLRPSHVLRPAGLLSHLKWPLSQGFGSVRCRIKPLVSYQTCRLLSGWDFHPQVICALGAHSGVLNLRGIN